MLTKVNFYLKLLMFLNMGIILFLFFQAEISLPISSSPSAPQEILGVETPIISERYVLMPGDGLLITVTGGITYSYDAVITYEGKITIQIPKSLFGPWERSLPQREIVDVINIHGLTLKEAQDSLTSVFSRYFKEVKIKLTLTNLRSIVVFVTGEVQNPGAYNASPVERVSHVILRAGNLTPLGSKRNIKLIRQDTLIIPVDLEKFETKGDISANPFLESGDRIYVPPRVGSVIVKGAVFGRGEYRIRYAVLTAERERISEGLYELSPGERVSDIIEKAGGVAPWADLDASYLERINRTTGEKVKIPLKISKILQDKNHPENIELRDGDAIIIPAIKSEVYVQGEVNSPGSYLFFPNNRASDYIGKAGGYTIFANRKKAYIQRGNKKISLKDDPIVEPGDKIFVPRLSFKWWQDYVTILAAFTPFAGSIAYLLLAR